MQPIMPEVSIQSHTLAYSTSALSFQLSIPKFNEAADRDINPQPFTLHLQRHLAFRQAAEPEGSDLVEKAGADLKGIQFTFPMAQTPEIILAAAAAFALQCLIDDWVEAMDVHSAEETLETVIDILSQPYSVGCMNTVHSSKDSGCVLLESLEAKHATIVFRNHVFELLDAETFVALMRDQVVMHAAMIKELSFRHSHTADLSQYLEIGMATMGIQQFLTLFRNEMGLRHLSERLSRLEQEVIRAARLANDLVGLEKDICTSPEWMNYAVIASGSQPASIDSAADGIAAAVKVHNLATEACAELMTGLVGDELAAASAAVGFVGRHLKWAMNAKRYKAQ